MMEKLAVKRLTDMSSSFLHSIAYGPFDVTTVTLLLNVSVWSIYTYLSTFKLSLDHHVNLPKGKVWGNYYNKRKYVG